MKTKCPKCGEEIALQAIATMVDKQILFVSLKSDTTDLFSAQTVGKMIKATADLQVAVAKDIGFKAHVFIESVKVEPKNITIGFMIARVR